MIEFQGVRFESAFGMDTGSGDIVHVRLVDLGITKDLLNGLKRSIQNTRNK